MSAVVLKRWFLWAWRVYPAAAPLREHSKFGSCRLSPIRRL